MDNTVEVADLIAAAKSLLSDMPDNPEYDRGVIELLADALHIDKGIAAAFLQKEV